MNFKEFLEKEEAVVEYESACFPKEYFKSAGEDYFEQPQRVIKSKDLGEWAWNEWLNSDFFYEEKEWWLEMVNMLEKDRKEFEEECEKNREPCGGEYPLSHIASSCLGEKEIRKRLEVLE